MIKNSCCCIFLYELNSLGFLKIKRWKFFGLALLFEVNGCIYTILSFSTSKLQIRYLLFSVMKPSLVSGDYSCSNTISHIKQEVTRAEVSVLRVHTLGIRGCVEKLTCLTSWLEGSAP